MAGSKLVLPANGAADWSGWVTAVERVWRGYMQVSFDNMESSAASILQAGSAVEMGGSLYQFGTDEEMTTGWSAITTATTAYMKFVPASTEVTWEYTAVAPVWDDDKQGWYGTSGSATHRYIGTVYKTGTTSYGDTNIFGVGKYQTAGGTRNSDDQVYKFKIIEIGDWDMSGSTSGATKSTAHGLGSTHRKRIRGIKVIIRRDDDVTSHDLSAIDPDAAIGEGVCMGGVHTVDNTNVQMERRNGTHFDGANFNATSYNRGWITIWYEP